MRRNFVPLALFKPLLGDIFWRDAVGPSCYQTVSSRRYYLFLWMSLPVGTRPLVTPPFCSIQF